MNDRTIQDGLQSCASLFRVQRAHGGRSGQFITLMSEFSVDISRAVVLIYKCIDECLGRNRHNENQHSNGKFVREGRIELL